MSLGILGLAGIHHYVHDLEESRRFYVDRLGFDEIGRSSAELERAGRQRSLVFRCGAVVVTCSMPLGPGGRAWRYLSRHPEGVGALAFEVADVGHTFTRLESNGGTPISDVLWQRDRHGSVGTFAITTPLGDTTFRFIERRGHRALFPGMEAYDIPRAGGGGLGALHVDHVTANFRTMKPALLWLEHVLEFRPFWDVEFHTQQDGGAEYAGSGLRSRVMWDAASGIKLASNEPLRPAFHRSQIDLFCEDNRGDGVQHVALAVKDIESAVRGLKQRGVQLMPPLPGYRERLLRSLPGLAHDPAELAELGILVDGADAGEYLLQIFLKEAALQQGRPEAGPFFFELIQRHGAVGFGEGNFKALFDGIATEQVARVG